MKEEFVSIIYENIEVIYNADGHTKVINGSQETFRVFYVDRVRSYNGYVNLDLRPNFWSLSNPSRWSDNECHGDFEVVVVGKNRYIVFKIMRSDMKILVEEDNSIKVKDYEVQINKISFILCAYKVKDYIDEAIKGILSLKTKYIQLEILIGIDNCEETLLHLTEKNYPPEVKVYFFMENVGLFIVKNSLIEKASFNDIIFMDPDDIPCSNMIKEYLRYNDEYDLITWGNYTFNDGDSFEQESNLTYKTTPNGCCGTKRNKLLKINGFQPWRCQADDELDRRTFTLSWKRKFIDLPLFYYRIRKHSLSNDELTKKGSVLRENYLKIMTHNFAKSEFPNPDRLYKVECLRIK